MDPNGLMAFAAIARLGGVGRAGRALGRSQPAISRRIELLEAELGARLFERGSGGLQLTDAGQALLPHAEACLAAARDGAAAVRALSEPGAGTVTFAVVGTLADRRLTALLRAFCEAHPRARLDLRTGNSREVGDFVRRGEATIGLRYAVGGIDGLVEEEIARDPMVIICAAEHRLGDARPHPPSDLAGERWVAFSGRARDDRTDAILAQRLASAGLTAGEMIPIDSLTAQKRLVEAGFGIAQVAASGVGEELREGSLRIIDVPALSLATPVMLTLRREGFLNPAARSLIDNLRRDLVIGPARP